MATGRDMQLTRQIGEHLVAAELGRRGYIASPFSGNVPMFDILAADLRGFAIPIQVKSIRGPSWQLRIDTFLDIEIIGKKQVVRGKKELVNPNLVCIFVVLKEPGEDQFYIFRLRDLQEHFSRTYKPRVSPNNAEVTHCAVWPSALAKFRDNWALVKAEFDRVMNERAKAPTAIPFEKSQEVRATHLALR